MLKCCLVRVRIKLAVIDGILYEVENILEKVPKEDKLSLINCYTLHFELYSWTFNGYFWSEYKKCTSKLLSTSKNLLFIHVYLESDSMHMKTEHPLIKCNVIKTIEPFLYCLNLIKY